jgi:hypothetical protein
MRPGTLDPSVERAANRGIFSAEGSGPPKYHQL